MIDVIQLENFQAVVNCHSDLYSSQETFLPVNYQFKKGNVYGLCSDFGCGSWGIATCLCGRGSENYTGKIYLNHNEIQLKILNHYSAIIPSPIFDSLNSEGVYLTVKECICKALDLSKLPYSFAEIKEIFCLTDNRIDRYLFDVSGEIWLISLAVNFALGKSLFCYPWLNEMDCGRVKIIHQLGILDFLKENGKIIVIPSSQRKMIKKYCDHVVLFQKGKIHYF